MSREQCKFMFHYSGFVSWIHPCRPGWNFPYDYNTEFGPVTESARRVTGLIWKKKRPDNKVMTGTGHYHYYITTMQAYTTLTISVFFNYQPAFSTMGQESACQNNTAYKEHRVNMIGKHLPV